jgi:cysteine desulfurase / selenocysteine lyase
MSTPTPTGNGYAGPRFVVPDEATLARLANDVLNRLTAEPAAPSPLAELRKPPAGHLGEPSYYFIDEAAGGPAAVGQSAPAVPADFNVNAVRGDFPVLGERVNGRPLAWLDNAATTQKPQPVIDRLASFYARENSNVHRGAHTFATRATDAYEEARSKVAAFLGAGSAEEIVFTRGTTESINLVAQSWGRSHVGPGDEIVLSQLEHHANIVPWQLLAEQTGARLRVIEVEDDGRVAFDRYTALLSDRTKLVAVAHVSNVLGTVLPVAEIAAAAHRAGARVLVDGAQAVAHLPVSVTALDADFYAFSGHKVFGPTGIGALYAKAEILADMPPWQGGGNMISDVTFERTRYAPAPAKFEAGTANIAGAIGLGEAIDYVSRLGLAAIGGYEHQLLGYATGQMKAVPGLRLIGTAPEKTGLLTFVLDGHEPGDVGAALDREGIEVRAGHHCAQPILRRYGLEAAVRPSLAMYNTCAEVDRLVAALYRIAGRGTSGRI